MIWHIAIGHSCNWTSFFFLFSTVNGADVYMNSCLYGNGTSFVESLFEDFGELDYHCSPI